MDLPISPDLYQKVLAYVQTTHQSLETVLTNWLEQAQALPDPDMLRDALAQSEARLQTFLDVLPVGVTILDENRQIIDMNPITENILGMSITNLRVGLHAQRRYIYPDGAPMSFEEFPSVRAMNEQRAIFDVEIGVVKDDGSVIWVSVNAAPLPNHQGVIIVTTDITTKRYAELELLMYQEYLEELVAERTREIELANRKLQDEITERAIIQSALLAEKQQSESILNHMADNIVFADIQGNIIYVNPAWEAATGYSLAEVQGKNIRILQSGQTPRERYNDLSRSIYNGEVWHGEFINKRKDGSVFHSLETIVPVKNSNGEIIYFVGVSRDITQERRLAKMKEEFIANAAHDLNNPLTVLKTSLYLLKHDPTQVDHWLPVFEDQINRLETLVNDLLTISRLDRKALDFDFVALDCNHLVERVIRSQKSLAQQKEINLIYEPNPQLPLIKGDNNLLERVIVNLVANAINYTKPQGQVRVALAIEGDHGMFTIEDTGIGIAEKDLAFIFDRFYRSDLARQTANGTGLGLSIVKEVVELHHGKVEVMSKIGVGTRFRVYVPLAQVASNS
jgi:PAS domain S-box-containing protein